MSIQQPSTADLSGIRLTPGAAPRPLVIGSRSSLLALWQTEWVRRELAETVGADSRVLMMDTKGDRDLATPLPEIGGKGLFTAELEAAMRGGAIDAAVHSLKDLPVDDAEGLVVAAVCRRADPRDVLVSARGRLAELAAGARVGTSSRRRAAQLLAARPDLVIVPLRGNVETRIRKATTELDAAVLAAAGVERLGLGEAVREHLDVALMLPAPGQGAVAVQCRADDREAVELLRRIDHAPTRLATTAERAFLHALGGGCSAAIGALAEPLGDTGLLRMSAVVCSPDGREAIRLEGSDTDPVALGERLAARAIARGAAELLR